MICVYTYSEMQVQICVHTTDAGGGSDDLYTACLSVLLYFGLAYTCMGPATRLLDQLKGFCSLWLKTPFDGSEYG